MLVIPNVLSCSKVEFSDQSLKSTVFDFQKRVGTDSKFHEKCQKFCMPKLSTVYIEMQVLKIVRDSFGFISEFVRFPTKAAHFILYFEYDLKTSSKYVSRAEMKFEAIS